LIEARVDLSRGDPVNEPARIPKPNNSKSKFFILRNTKQHGVCLVIEAANAEEAKARAVKLALECGPALKDTMRVS
jgi:hypothetical protein